MKWAFRVSLAIAACLIGIASQRFVDRLMPTSQVAFESGPNQTNDFRNDRALRDYRFSVVISMDTGRNVYLGKKRIGSPDDVALITAISEKQYADCDIRCPGNSQTIWDSLCSLISARVSLTSKLRLRRYLLT